jgi:hypothetical protein
VIGVMNFMRCSFVSEKDQLIHLSGSLIMARMSMVARVSMGNGWLMGVLLAYWLASWTSVQEVTGSSPGMPTNFHGFRPLSQKALM